MTGGKTQPGPFEFQFKDDTGADYMVLYDEDVTRLSTNLQANDVSYPLPRILGVLVVTLGDGSKKAMLVRELEVNMWDEKEKKIYGSQLGFDPGCRSSWTGNKTPEWSLDALEVLHRNSPR